MNTAKLKQILLTYLRAGVAASIALYIADPSRNIKDYLTAALAGVAGPILKALDPSATEFGRGA